MNKIPLITYLGKNNAFNLYNNDFQTFKHMVNNDKKLAEYLNNHAYIYKGRPIFSDETARYGLLGFISALGDESVYPKNDYDMIKMNTNSANCSFCIFKRKKDDRPIFFKQAFDLADPLEIETVVMKTLYEYNICPKIITSVKACTNKNYLNFSSLLYIGDFINNESSFNQTIITEAIIPGFSLGYIITSLKNAMKGETLSEKEKEDVKLFIKNDFVELMTTNKSENEKVIEDNYDIFKNVLDRIINKVEELYKKILSIDANLCFAHGDMHMNNILYDMETDSLVLIDYGRSFINLNQYTKEQLEEYSEKLRSHYNFRLNLKINNDDKYDYNKSYTYNSYSTTYSTHSTTISNNNSNSSNSNDKDATKNVTDAFYDKFGSSIRKWSKNTNPSFLDRYNILHDFAGLSLVIYMEFFPYISDDLVDKNILDFTKSDIIINTSLPNIFNQIINTNSIFLFTLYYFVFIAVIMYPKLKDIDDLIKVLPNNNVMFPFKKLISKKAPFYKAGQILPKAYSDIYDDLSEAIKKYTNKLENRINSFTKNELKGGKQKLNISKYPTNKLILNYINNINNKSLSIPKKLNKVSFFNT